MEELKVKVNPFSKNLIHSILVIFFLIFFLLEIYNLFKDLFLFALSGLFLFFSLGNFFFPTNYIFTDLDFQIIRPFYKKIFPYSNFKNFSQEKNGIYLSPYSKINKFDNFRGIFLFMDKENQEKLKIILTRKIHN